MTRRGKFAVHEETSNNDLITLARADFSTFVELAFPVLHRGKRLVYAPYIDVITAILSGVTEGVHRRVVINLPPGYMKSMLCSVMYTAWRLGIDPTWKVICISYGDDLAHKLSVLTRTLVLSQTYRRIFPGTVLEKKAEDQLTTTKGGYRYSTQVHSDITGFRPNDIIIDDPIEPQDAANQIIKEKLRSWVDSSVKPRLDEPTTGAIVLVMHRVAPDDLSATFAEDEECFCLQLPIVAEKRERFVRRGKVIMSRAPGDPLNPDRLSKAGLEKLRRETPNHVWSSLYQQRPMPSGSGMILVERLRRYAEAPPYEYTIHSWDIGATEHGNPTVCTKFGAAKDDDGREVAYLHQVISFQVELPDVRDAIKAQDALDRPDIIVVDYRGVGLGVVQDLRNEGFTHLECLDGHSNEGKTLRFALASLAFYDGSVAFPQDGPFVERVLHALATFPNTKEVDLVDSITQVAAYLPRLLDRAKKRKRLPGYSSDAEVLKSILENFGFG